MNTLPGALCAAGRAGAGLALLLALVGCGSPPKVDYTPFEVDVEVSTPCAAEKPQAPARETDRLTAADSLDRMSQAALADLKKQESYIEKLKAATDGCR